MLNLSLVLFSFSASLFIGFFINKYSSSYFLSSFYYYLSLINLKHLLYIYAFLNIMIVFNHLDYFDLNLIMQICDSPNITPATNETQIPVTNDINNNSVILNNPHITINIPQEVAEKFVNGIALAAGAKIGLEIVKISPNIGIKAAAAFAGALSLTQIKESITKIYNNTSNKDNSSKYLYTNESTNSNTYDLSEYPLNLIDDLIVYNSLSFVFLAIIFNSFLAIYLKDFNIDIYLPLNSPNKLIKILRFLYDRFIRIWLSSSKFLIIYSSVFLLICLLMSKICLLIIKN